MITKVDAHLDAVVAEVLARKRRQLDLARASADQRAAAIAGTERDLAALRKRAPLALLRAAGTAN